MTRRGCELLSGAPCTPRLFRFAKRAWGSGTIGRVRDFIAIAAWGMAVLATTPGSTSEGPPRPRTVEQVVTHYRDAVRQRLDASLRAVGLKAPLAELALVALKAEQVVELWGRADKGVWKLVKRYPVCAASGGAGPKLAQGDLQVPEGLYRLSSLNPNSAFHLSMKVDYPNTDDRERARGDGRTKLGGDIFVHGNCASIGCLALGDEAIEELFVLVAERWPKQPQIVIAPRDFRTRAPEAKDLEGHPPWLRERYTHVAKALERFRVAEGE